MKTVIVLGNWKANKTVEEAQEWLKEFSGKLTSTPINISLIICPGYHHLTLFSSVINLFAIGVQDISGFTSGAFTGEVSSSMLKGLVQYALIGHSERRKLLGETDEIVSQKVNQSLSAGIIPIVCISELSQAQKLNELVPSFSQKGMVLYEPLFAVGTGNADTPENANSTALRIIEILGSIPILYGGSVVPENVEGFVKQEYISGVGVGGASLDPEKFFQLIKAASRVE